MLPKSRTAARKGKADASDISEDEVGKATRRTRQGSRAPSEGPGPVTRTTRKTTPAPTTTITRSRTTPTPTVAKTNTTRRGTKVKPMDNPDDLPDPLDSIGNDSAETEETAPAPKARRVVRGRPKIKEEEEESASLDQIDEEGEDVPASRPVRARKAMPTAKVAHGNANGKSTATRARPGIGRKTASAEPAGPQVIEKENTPDPPDTETAVATKVAGAVKPGARTRGGRVAKPAGRTRAGTATEDEDGPVETTRTRGGRAKATVGRK